MKFVLYLLILIFPLNALCEFQDEMKCLNHYRDKLDSNRTHYIRTLNTYIFLVTETEGPVNSTMREGFLQIEEGHMQFCKLPWATVDKYINFSVTNSNSAFVKMIYRKNGLLKLEEMSFLRGLLPGNAPSRHCTRMTRINDDDGRKKIYEILSKLIYNEMASLKDRSTSENNLLADYTIDRSCAGIKTLRDYVSLTHKNMMKEIEDRELPPGPSIENEDETPKDNSMIQ